MLSALRLMRAQPAIALVASLTMIGLGIGFLVVEPLMLDLMVSSLGPVIGGQVSTVATVVACWGAIGLLGGYCDVVTLTMVRDRQRTGAATIREGVRAANARIRTIGGWTGITVVNVALLGMLRMVPGTRLLRWTGNLAWELATFFVMPVIAFESHTTSGAVRRSAGMIRRQAKDAIAPYAGIFVACLPTFVPGLALLMLAYVTPVMSLPPGAPFPPPDATLLTLAMVAILPGATLVGTSTLLLRYALYQRATGGEAPAAYGARDLEAAMPSLVETVLPSTAAREALTEGSS